MNKPAIPFNNGGRFITDEGTVAAVIALDHLLEPVAELLKTGAMTIIGNPARLYLVDGANGRVAFFDCERPFLWLGTAEDVVQQLGCPVAVMFDLMPWRRAFTVKAERPMPPANPWWDGPGAPAVRCTDCQHCPPRMNARCEATGDYHRGNAYLRRCKAYSARQTRQEAA